MDNIPEFLNKMKYSFSSTNTYVGCPYAFKLTYIDKLKGVGNFFSDYGTFCHEIIEKFFRGTLEPWDMAQYYKDNFSKSIRHSCPSYPVNMRDGYYYQGLTFFTNFSFDKSPYHYKFIEDYISGTHKDINFVVKPDLVLKHKETKEYMLVDYKTAKLKEGKAKIKQLEEYKRQFLMYCYFIWTEKNVEITSIKIWFIRDNTVVDIPIVQSDYLDMLEWFESNVYKIRNETDWKPNLDKDNEYFCKQICGHRLGNCKCRA